MKIKAVKFANGVRCGKGGIEEVFIDVDYKANSTTKSKYTLEMDDRSKEVTVHNLDTGKTVVVFPTNIAYYEPITEHLGANESANKRTNKTITQ